jgi:hypothetical protein
MITSGGRFLKNFGLGLVYIFLLPLLLVVLALFGVYALGVLIVEFFTSTIRFFQGKDPFPILWEDLKVQEIKKAQMDAQTPTAVAPTPSSPAGPSTVYVQQNYYQNQPGSTSGNASSNNAPLPNPANQPIDASAFFKDQAAPTLDVSTPASRPLPNPSAPQLPPSSGTPSPISYIDISTDDEKEGKS